MTCKVERYNKGAPKGRFPGELKSMTFHCDADGCNIVADDAEIENKGGLRYMGWWAAGGKHFCPKHFDQGGKRQW
jgi:hypothetical protein